MRKNLAPALILAVTAALFLRVHFLAAQGGARDTLRIGLVIADSAARTPAMRSAERGVRIGADEAARSAALFGRAVTLAEGNDAERLIREGRVQALVGGFSDDECRALQAAAERGGVVFFDVGCTADALRGAECRAAAFHVAPSAAMEAGAATAPGVAAGGRVVAWDSRLAKFGADALNDRYRARFGEGMDSQGWAGWFGVKMLWESTLRAGSAAPAALAAYLTSGAARFDGHKGRALSFRRWDHQLREPLYVVDPANPSADPVEVPRADPAAELPSQEVLDRLGTTAASSACHLGP